MSSFEIAYDMLIICTGTPYSAPIRPSRVSLEIEARCEEICRYTKQLGVSEKIVVLGGGANKI